MPALRYLPPNPADNHFVIEAKEADAPMMMIGFEGTADMVLSLAHLLRFGMNAKSRNSTTLTTYKSGR